MDIHDEGHVRVISKIPRSFLAHLSDSSRTVLICLCLSKLSPSYVLSYPSQRAITVRNLLFFVHIFLRITSVFEMNVRQVNAFLDLSSSQDNGSLPKKQLFGLIIDLTSVWEDNETIRESKDI